MSDPPKRSQLTSTPAMRAAVQAPVSTIKAKPKSKLERNTRLGEVYWCSFSPHNWPPEFDDKHLVVVIRGGNREDGHHLVIPLTSQPQTGDFAYQLQVNPNPRSAAGSWAVCDHVYTVSSARLELLRDDENNPRRSVTVSDEDLDAIGRRMFAALNSLRRRVYGALQKQGGVASSAEPTT